jgi:hypothetical protein
VEAAVDMMGEGGDTANGEKTKSLPPWLSKVPYYTVPLSVQVELAK